MGSYDNGGTAMVDELFKVEVKVTIPKRDGAVLTRDNILEIKRRLNATEIQYYLLSLGEEWNYIDTEMSTVVVMTPV